MTELPTAIPGHWTEHRDGRTIYHANYTRRTRAEREYEAGELLRWLRNGNPSMSEGGPFLNPRHLFKVATEAEPQLEINWYRKDAEHPEPDINIYDPESGAYFEAPLVRGVISWEAWEMCPAPDSAPVPIGDAGD